MSRILDVIMLILCVSAATAFFIEGNWKAGLWAVNCGVWVVIAHSRSS